MPIIYVSFFNGYVITAFMSNSLNMSSGLIVRNFWDILSPVKAYLLIPLKLWQDIMHWKPPTSVHQIRSFLGLAGYYRRFIPDFSKIAKPMKCEEATQEGD
jgi:hypothetical protein